MLVDLYRVSSVADVTVRLERAYAKQLKGELRERVEAFLQRTGVGLSLGAFGISAQLQLEPMQDPLPALHALLELPLRLEAAGGYRAYIAFDEFQDIGRIDGLDGLLRSHIQHHGEVASYVFAGSEPGLMRLLFESKDRPLYGSAVPMRLGRLDDADIAAYVAARFEATGRSVGRDAQPAPADRAGPPAAGDAPGAPAVGGGGVGRGGDARRLGPRARGRDARARRRVRRPVARARHLGAEDAALAPSRRRRARTARPRSGGSS